MVRIKKTPTKIVRGDSSPILRNYLEECARRETPKLKFISFPERLDKQKWDKLTEVSKN